jgi:hypothetical protein
MKYALAFLLGLTLIQLTRPDYNPIWVSGSHIEYIVAPPNECSGNKPLTQVHFSSGAYLCVHETPVQIQQLLKLETNGGAR